MDQSLWALFWATGLPQAYTLAKAAQRQDQEEPAERSA